MLNGVRDRLARFIEATPQQRVMSGASSSGWGTLDPIDGPGAWRPYGTPSSRDVPQLTREQAQVDSIASFRTNPMARAMISTYVAFCVGDSGVSIQCPDAQVQAFVDRFWTDPKNRLADGVELMFQDWLLRGEQLQEMRTGPVSGASRRAPIDVGRIRQVDLEQGNPLWPERVGITSATGDGTLQWFDVIEADDLTGLMGGEVFFWPGFKTLETDVRGAPFLMPVLDWLDSYDVVLSNLIDRTALMRYISWDVTLTGADEDEINAWVRARGGRHIPRSGTMEVHNESVDMKAMTATTGAYEDVRTNQAIMTSIAAGGGLSKVWLAEPEDANRATSLTMAEPVRRRIGSVQNIFLAQLRSMIMFAVDQGVAAGRLPETLPVATPGGGSQPVPTSSTIQVIGPQIAAADAQMMASVFMQLGQSLAQLVTAGIMPPEAAREAAKKAWTDYMGTPYRPELDAGLTTAAPAGAPPEPPTPEQTDALAEHIDQSGGSVPLVAA